MLPEHLAKMWPKSNRQHIEQLCPILDKWFIQYDINNTKRMAMFLAQIGHESQNFTRIRENLNYSAERLRVVFKKYFCSVDKKQDDLLLAKALDYARNPEKIANYVYANRMGNGPEESGDGYKYRGLGYIQLTGKENQLTMAKQLNMSLDKFIEYASTMDGAVHTACVFWNDKNINQPSDKEDIGKVTKLINGGLIGLDDRTKRYNLARRVLG